MESVAKGKAEAKGKKSFIVGSEQLGLRDRTAEASEESVERHPVSIAAFGSYGM